MESISRPFPPTRRRRSPARQAGAFAASAVLSLLFAALFVYSSVFAAPEPTWYVVVDRAGILDDGQEQSAIYDAWRMNLIGIPVQVVTENTALTQDQADARAEELRTTGNIESAPGADDGMLVYASVDPSDSSHVVMSISVGERAIPRNGLTAGSIDDVRSDIVDAQLAAGQPARAIVYSLREFIYLEQYVPPAVPPLDGWRLGLHRIAAIAAPILSIGGAAFVIVKRHRGSVRARLARLAGAAALAVVLTIAGVLGESTIAIFAAVALGGVAIWQVIVLDDGRAGTPPASRRVVRATPRPPRLTSIPSTRSRAARS